MAHLVGCVKMCDCERLGRTPYGGEIYALTARRPWFIPALRCVVSIGKLGKRSSDLFEAIEYFNSRPSAARGLVRRVCSYGHVSIGEMGFHAIYLRGVSRLTTLVSWVPVGAPRGIQGVGTERSLRWVRAREFVKSSDAKLNRLSETAFEVYHKLLDGQIPQEDSRYALLLTTQTEEILQIPVGRELAKWARYMAAQPFGEAKSIGRHVARWNRRLSGLELPKEPPREEEFMPLLAQDVHVQRERLARSAGISYDPTTQTLTMCADGSIASWHQQVRDRQERLLWPAWQTVISSPAGIVPPSLTRSPLRHLLTELYHASHSLAVARWTGQDYEVAVLAQPLGRRIRVVSLIHGTHNIWYTVRLRACMAAQWEIRTRFRQVVTGIQPHFPHKLGARCETEGRCFEPRGKKCQLYAKYVKE